jgi:hypothetical protein
MQHNNQANVAHTKGGKSYEMTLDERNNKIDIIKLKAKHQIP